MKKFNYIFLVIGFADLSYASLNDICEQVKNTEDWLLKSDQKKLENVGDEDSFSREFDSGGGFVGDEDTG